MRQASIQQKNYPRLRVANETNSEQRLINSAWNFVYTALWNDTQFSEKEIARAKELITEYLKSDNIEKAFSSFCQRVLLARHYVTKSPSRYIPLPSVWLDKDNKLGFSGTESWLERVTEVRDSVPGYKTGIKALADAVLEFSKEPTISKYQQWRNYFIDHQSPGLLTLFQATACQQVYNWVD
jgi:hypothetical protein